MSLKLQKITVDTARVYDLWSKEYDIRLSHTVLAARAALDELVPELHGKSVLEVGCGTGANLELIAAGGISSAVGLDLSNGMLSQARAKQYGCPVQFLCHDANNGLPLQSDSIDFVLVSLVLEHIADIDYLLKEISRVLKTGGRSLIVELHPFRALQDGFARFVDHSAGLEYRADSRSHSVSDLINAHLTLNLILDRVLETCGGREEVPSIFAILSTLRVL